MYSIKLSLPFCTRKTAVQKCFVICSNNVIRRSRTELDGTSSLLCAQGEIYHSHTIREFRNERTSKENSRKQDKRVNTWKIFLPNLLSKKDKKSEDIINKLLTRYNIQKSQVSLVKLIYEEGKQDGRKSLAVWRKFASLIGIVLIGYLVYDSITFGHGFDLPSSTFSKKEDVETDSNIYEMQHPDVKFDDVKGIDEVKEELENLTDFLKNPFKYWAVGGKLPKGILLVGPPGTGKTLLAKAISGEAGVPFFFASGAEFDEMYVGVGSKRIRELFKKARLNSPCIIFIDEIDACGNHRTATGSQPYARQTINQLLQEMDGFKDTEGVLVLAATNTVEVLDKALMRPGRFDVVVNTMAPDVTGRRDILQLYAKKIVHDKDNIDFDRLSRLTSGMTGADLRNLINQAAIEAGRRSKGYVSMCELEHALDKIKMGSASKGRVCARAELENTAFHEAGHAIAAYYTPGSDQIYKASIRQRGQALGHVSFVPNNELSPTKTQLLARIDVAMAGRVAEEITYGEGNVTTGASSDLCNATEIATVMVLSLGMGKRGLVTQSVDSISEVSKRDMEVEVNDILKDSYKRMKMLLQKRHKEHKLIAMKLLEKETLNLKDIEKILSGEKMNESESEDEDLTLKLQD